MGTLNLEPIDAGVADPSNYGSKPLIFFDIDGVFNRIPFIDLYIGPKCDCRTPGWCPHRGNEANWTPLRTELGEDLYDDVPATVEEGIRIHPSWQIPLWISSELSAELQTLYRSEKVDIIFLSMWEANSRFLNGFLGTSIPHVKLSRKFTESERSIKHRNLFRFLSDLRKIRGSVPPFIWVDDVVTRSERGVSIESEVRKGLKALNVQETPPMLILNTDTSEGLRRSHWKQILEFVELHAGEAQQDHS